MVFVQQCNFLLRVLRIVELTAKESPASPPQGDDDLELAVFSQFFATETHPHNETELRLDELPWVCSPPSSTCSSTVIEAPASFFEWMYVSECENEPEPAQPLDGW